MIRPADDYERWQTEVRDPALAAREQTVTLYRRGDLADYTLAPVPGGWAWNAHAWAPDGSGGGSSWNGPVPTRNDALEAALRYIVRTLRAHDPDSPLAARITPDQGALF